MLLVSAIFDICNAFSRAIVVVDNCLTKTMLLCKDAAC